MYRVGSLSEIRFEAVISNSERNRFVQAGKQTIEESFSPDPKHGGVARVAKLYKEVVYGVRLTVYQT